MESYVLLLPTGGTRSLLQLDPRAMDLKADINSLIPIGICGDILGKGQPQDQGH